MRDIIKKKYIGGNSSTGHDAQIEAKAVIGSLDGSINAGASRTIDLDSDGSVASATPRALFQKNFSSPAQSPGQGSDVHRKSKASGSGLWKSPGSSSSPPHELAIKSLRITFQDGEAKEASLHDIDINDETDDGVRVLNVPGFLQPGDSGPALRALGREIRAIEGRLASLQLPLSIEDQILSLDLQTRASLVHTTICQGGFSDLPGFELLRARCSRILEDDT